MKLLIFATLFEAEASIKALNAEATSDPDCFLYDQGKIVISGWGCYYAMMAVSKYGQDVDEVVNLGIAASLKNHPLGHVTTIKSVSKYSSEPFAKSLPVLEVTDGAHLVSFDFPVHSTDFHSKLEPYDLLDMEGYGIVFASNYLKKKVTLIKAVSDFAQEGARHLIEQNKEKLSSILAEHSLKL